MGRRGWRAVEAVCWIGRDMDLVLDLIVPSHDYWISRSDIGLLGEGHLHPRLLPG
jgi:hypothetical protein